MPCAAWMLTLLSMVQARCRTSHGERGVPASSCGPSQVCVRSCRQPRRHTTLCGIADGLVTWVMCVACRRHRVSVVLTEPMEHLGFHGQEVSVKAGFARNYLIPQRKAVYATPENVKVYKLNKPVRSRGPHPRHVVSAGCLTLAHRWCVMRHRSRCLLPRRRTAGPSRARSLCGAPVLLL